MNLLHGGPQPQKAHEFLHPLVDRRVTPFFDIGSGNVQAAHMSKTAKLFQVRSDRAVSFSKLRSKNFYNFTPFELRHKTPY